MRSRSPNPKTPHRTFAQRTSAHRKMRRASNRSVLALTLLALLSLAGGLGCSSNSDDGVAVFVVRGARGAIDLSVAVTAEGNWVVYFEDEDPGGAALAPGDLNGDLDTNDSVAVAVNVIGNVVHPLAVDAEGAHVVGNEVYLEVVEADDGRDWNGDGMMDDLVLVHWSATSAGMANGSGICNAADVCYVDDLDAAVAAPARRAVALQGRLFYTSGISAPDLTALGDGGTSLRMLESTDPLNVMAVTHGETGQRRPRIVGPAGGGLLALALDETVEGLALNAGDADMTDTAVLALLDGTDPARGIESTERALAVRTLSGGPAYAPVVARRNAANTDWLVAFLVSEADEGGASLNDRDLTEFMGTGWEPVQCMTRDTDASDSVLHFLHFEGWFADAAMSPIRNTGLVGRDPAGTDPDRVGVVEGYVAVLSDEASAGCDLNVDSDTSDAIVRWTAAPTDPMVNLLPPGAAMELHATEDALPGASEGFSTLGNRFVIVVDEAKDGDDLDSDSLMTKDLVGWLDPASTTTTTWTFLHQGQFTGAAWMDDEESAGRLGIALQESVLGVSVNSGCKSVAFADPDTNDELPVFARFSGTTLIFPGVGLALAPGNPGLAIEGFTAYFRVSEAAQSQDLNLDGDQTDFILMRNSLFACQPGFMGTTTNPAMGDDLLFTSGTFGAAFVGSETDAGVDFNDNGNVGEDVLLFFALP